MSGMTRGIVGRVRRAGWRAKVALALGLGAGLGAAGLGIAAAGGPACDPASIRERVAALEAKYDAMPELTDPEAVYQRSQRFEEEWKALGALCSRPNGTEPEPPLRPEDPWVYVDRIGIRPIDETSVRGYDVVNGWTQVVDVDGAPFVVHVAAVFSSEDPTRAGVIVYRYGPAPVVVLTDEWGSTQGTIVDPVVGSPRPGVKVDAFPGIGVYLQPKADGPLKIVAEDDLVLTLEGRDGERFAFDVLRLEWVEPQA